MNTELAALARRLVWWKTPEEALADQDRFLAQVMTYGTWRDIVEARAHWPENAFREALRHAPPGVFDERSWTYWHYFLDLVPIPPRPLRKFADARGRVSRAGSGVSPVRTSRGIRSLRNGAKATRGFLEEIVSARRRNQHARRVRYPTLRIDRAGPVKLSFFGGLTFGRVATPDEIDSQSFKIASLRDLLATKLKVLWQRAEAKDYVDVAAIIGAGVSLAEGLGCANALYGSTFNPAIVLKALTFFEDGDLKTLSADVRELLIQASTSVRAIPEICCVAPNIGAEETFGG